MAFNLGKLLKPVAAPSLLPTKLGDVVPQIKEAITTPAFPAAAGTTSEALAQEMKGQGLPARPFGTSSPPTPGVPPGVGEAVSQTYDPRRPLSDHVRDLKTTLGSFFTHSVDTPIDFKKAAVRARERLNAAESISASDIADMLSSLDDDVLAPPSPYEPDVRGRAALVSKHMLVADTVQQMKRDKLKSLNGQSLAQWEEAERALSAEIGRDTGATFAAENLRGGLDEIFSDMVTRGWIAPDRYLEDYSPIQKINTVISSLARVTGESEGDVRARILSSTKSRGKQSDDAIREGNLINVLHRTRTEYYKKVAQHEFFTELTQSPWNMTEQFSDQETLPRGVSAYSPGPGQIGYIFSTPEQGYMAQMSQALDPEGKMRSGVYIFPTRLVEALKEFEPRRLQKQEEALLGGSQWLARNLTVYNYKNTQLNRASDLIVALLGMPGEKAQPLGILKFYHEGDKAAKSFVKGQKHVITIGGQQVDITDLISRQAIASSTFMSDISDNDMSAQLLRYLPESELEQQGWLDSLARKFENWRMTTELTPRIAAGLEALERTGDINEFGRVARNITLNFNEDAPTMTQQPVLRAMAPFVKFIGLASKRVFDLATTKGSRGRLFTSLIAVPTAAFMWNNQNENYTDVENAMPDWERDQLHWIMPGPDWSKPRLDVTGRPVVLRLRYFVPEEIMKLLGLGNLPSRFARVASGRDTPMDFVKSSVTTAAGGLGQMLVVPAVVGESLTGQTATGMPLTVDERITRLMPSLSGLPKVARAYESAPDGEKLGAAARMLFSEAAGLSYASVSHRQGRLVDRDIADIRREISDQQTAIRKLKRSGPNSELRAAYARLYELKDEAKRIRAATRDTTYNEFTYPARSYDAYGDSLLLEERRQQEQRRNR